MDERNGRRRGKRPSNASGKRSRSAGLAAAALAFLLGFSLTMALSYPARSLRIRAENDSLARERERMRTEEGGASETPEPAPTEGKPADEEPGAAGDAAPAEEAEMPGAEPKAPGGIPASRKTARRVYHRMDTAALPEMAALRERNRDLVGWLRIEGVLDLPVVWRDNQYYLDHGFDGRKNEAGTLFLDEYHRFSEETANLLIHGHNRKDGSMFGRLVHYLDADYLKRHPILWFDTLWERERYAIIAVIRVTMEDGTASFDYLGHARFESDGEYERFVREAQLASEHAIPVGAEPGDALLTLSTCLDRDRLVILARRFRGGETEARIRSLTAETLTGVRR